jgi:hypothetical protein
VQPEIERPRRSHRTDWMALLSGLLFIAMGLAFASGSLTDPIDALLFLLAGLGVAGFVAIIARVIRGR